MSYPDFENRILQLPTFCLFSPMPKAASSTFCLITSMYHEVQLIDQLGRGKWTLIDPDILSLSSPLSCAQGEYDSYVYSLRK